MRCIAAGVGAALLGEGQPVALFLELSPLPSETMHK